MQISHNFPARGAVATPPPKPEFAADATLDTVVTSLESQWSDRMRGGSKCDVGIFVELGYHPSEQHDDVLDLADAVMDAGGTPHLIYQSKPVEEQMQKVDAVLFPGGRDWTPSEYGEQLGPHMDPKEPDKAWDDFEIAGMRYAVAHNMPLFGQCRGEQGLNVALGGTLFQDLPSDRPGITDHHPPAVTDFASRMEAVHGLDVEPENRLFQMVGAHVDVNSIHHQAVKDLAPSLQAIAHAPDGLIEGVQVQGRPHEWAVQFHPEALRYTDARFQGVYDQLVDDGFKFHNHQPI